jgi:hypothetical protein
MPGAQIPSSLDWSIHIRLLAFNATCPKIDLTRAIHIDHGDKFNKQIEGTVVCPPKMGVAIGSDHSLSFSRKARNQ